MTTETLKQLVIHSGDNTVMNWIVIVGAAALSWIQPIAGVIAILWGGLQIYAWIVNKRWKKQ